MTFLYMIDIVDVLIMLKIVNIFYFLYLCNVLGEFLFLRADMLKKAFIDIWVLTVRNMANVNLLLIIMRLWVFLEMYFSFRKRI